MLVLTRKLGGRIYIGDDITITVVDIDRGKIRLGLEAPREVPIYRDDLCEPGTRAPGDVNRAAEAAMNILRRPEGD